MDLAVRAGSAESAVLAELETLVASVELAESVESDLLAACPASDLVDDPQRYYRRSSRRSPLVEPDAALLRQTSTC